jgi:hypothetical protein
MRVPAAVALRPELELAARVWAVSKGVTSATSVCSVAFSATTVT